MKTTEIRTAYARIRTIDHTISDDVLDFMKDAAIEKIESSEFASLKEEKNKSIDEFMSDYFTIHESLEELAKKITINNNDVYLTVAGKLVKLPSPPKEEK